MKRDLETLTRGVFDLLIIGGGISGAGVALDASLRGLRVALVDKGDFASGTSSLSSKLVHGGLRYLEHGDLGLVHEALQERRRLLRNAPHLVSPLPFIFPFYEGYRVPPWKGRLGLALYDLLAGRDNLRRSRPRPLPQLLKEFPGLRRQGLRAAFEYYDAGMDDARLCLEVMQAAVDAGAVVANYAEVVGFEATGTVLHAARVRDVLGGAIFPIAFRQCLNATGPWVDSVCRLAGEEESPRIQPTKGVHLVAPGRGLASAFLLFHPRDGRVLFVIPWMGKTLIGTTDTLPTDGPDALSVQEDEVSYLLEAHNHYFEPALTADDLLGSFAGLRPLARIRPGSPSARSREFQLFHGPTGLWTATGGKYTTYRSMAESMTDAIVASLGKRARCRTADHPLPGTPKDSWLDFRKHAPTSLALTHGLSPEAAWHLVQRYGQHAERVAANVREFPQLARPIHPEEPDLAVEFLHHKAHEMAILPGDFLLRRTRLGLFHPKLLQSPPSLTQGS